MELEVPALLDDMDDTASEAYASLPDRLYLIGKDGKIAFAGARGPRGFKVDLLQKAMEAEVKEIETGVEKGEIEVDKIEAEIEKAKAELKEIETRSVTQ